MPPQAPSRAYTPKHLSEKILTTRAALEGERKQVTVLFADVKGSMELAEQLDPEVWHQILERFFEILTEGVHRFEGTVNQYTGDGIMALFGAPIAHEDHAQRACYAALHLRAALRQYTEELKRERSVNFAVRMGINSGDVVVGKIGDDLRMDYTAQGHTIGLAQRIEQLADPGSAYLSPETARLVDGFFELRDLGSFQLKGVQDSVALYELLDTGTVQTRLERARVRGFSRFVGRAEESATLEAALRQAEQGNGQVVGVVAAAGVGKSRLCLEFLEGCRARGIPVNQAHCPAHGKNVPYLPILELLRDTFGIEDGDTDQVARDRVAGRLLLLDAEFREQLPLVFEFLGIADRGQPELSMDPELRQRRLHAFVRRLFKTSASRGPLVVLVDDLHWIDPASDRFVAQLVEEMADTSGLLLVNFRPEYSASWTRRSYYTQLALAPLAPLATEELIRGILGQDPSLTELARQIRNQTGGNPFFTEELVRDLIEAGSLEGIPGAYRLETPIRNLEIPATVHATLAARIDRLAPDPKHVLQTAAVIGKEFSESLLLEVSDLPVRELRQALEILRDGEFIQEEEVYPVAEYAFKHPLTLEVASASQLREHREQTHAAVARGIEALHGERLDEMAALIADHWDQAGERRAAAGWHKRAAAWIGVTDPEECSRHWERVRTLVGEISDSEESVALGIAACRGVLNLGWRLGTARELDGVFRDGCALAERHGDRRSLAILYNLYGNVRGISGDLATYHQYATEALRIAEAETDADTQRGLAADLSVVEWWMGDLHKAFDRVEVHLSAPADSHQGDFLDFPPGLQLLWSRACLLGEMGRLSEARVEIGRAISEAQEAGSLELVGWMQAWEVPIIFRIGDVESAMGSAIRAVENVAAVGMPLSTTWMRIFLGMAHLLNQDWESAARSEREALELIQERHAHFGFAAWAHAYLAEAELGRGEPAVALAESSHAIDLARQFHTRLCEMDGLLAHARALLKMRRKNSHSEIEEDLRRVELLAETSGAGSRLPVVAELRAELASASGSPDTADRQLREAQHLYEEIGAAGHAERIARELGDSPSVTDTSG